MSYPLFKALHIVFMVTWFAGLFYLPRLFIYHTDAVDEVSLRRFETMERRLFAIMTIGALLTTVLGLALLALNPALMDAGWFRLKALLLLGLFVYHYRSFRWMRQLATGWKPADTRWLRWFNEIPVTFLLLIIGLAVIKPLLG